MSHETQQGVKVRITTELDIIDVNDLIKSARRKGINLTEALSLAIHRTALLHSYQDEGTKILFKAPDGTMTRIFLPS